MINKKAQIAPFLMGKIMKICKKCNIEKSKDEFYVNNALKDKLTSRCRSCIDTINRQKVLENPEEIKRRQKIKDLRGRYNLSIDRYEEMMLEQNGCCGICNKEKKLVVDHCHNTKKVRMLLCSTCNIKVGILEDDPAEYKMLIEYIERFKFGAFFNGRKEPRP